MFEIILKL